MNIEAILSTVDHTLLSPTATTDEILALCDDAKAFHTASVCVPPLFVDAAVRHLQNALPVATVVGFPNGYNGTAIKALETQLALNSGAQEIDMVISIGLVKEKRWEDVEKEIVLLKQLCGSAILKVIVETCLLTKEEKIELCKVVSASGADFIKTSTGFSTGGATVEDVLLFKEHLTGGVRIKAAGGIRSFEDAEALLQRGASRLGTSALVRLAKEMKKS